jgi:PEGA domain
VYGCGVNARFALIVWIVAAGCSSNDKPEQPPPPPRPVLADAGVDGITTIGAYDPASGRHLDDDGTGHTLARPTAPRPGRPIDIILRSTPPGAVVMVDNVPIGNTPTYWAGMADGKEHTFSFELAGYAGQFYRFVPVTGGVIHVRLDPVTGEPDAGAPEPPAAPPQVAPPPTMITPDAAVAPKPPDAALAPVASDAAASTGSDTGFGPTP